MHTQPTKTMDVVDVNVRNGMRAVWTNLGKNHKNSALDGLVERTSVSFVSVFCKPNDSKQLMFLAVTDAMHCVVSACCCVLDPKQVTSMKNKVFWNLRIRLKQFDRRSNARQQPARARKFVRDKEGKSSPLCPLPECCFDMRPITVGLRDACERRGRQLLKLHRDIFIFAWYCGAFFDQSIGRVPLYSPAKLSPRS